MAREGSDNQTGVGESSEAKFDLLFRGDIAPGNSVDKVRERVAESFNLDQAAIDQLFSGAVISLKRNVDRATAERIYQRLSDAGAVANIVPSVSGSDSNELDSNELGNNESGNKEQDSSDPDTQSDRFTLAPLGSDVSDTADTAEDQPSNVSIDHLGLEPVGSNIVEQEERETIEPVEVDTSHLSLE